MVKKIFSTIAFILLICMSGNLFSQEQIKVLGQKLNAGSKIDFMFTAYEINGKKAYQVKGKATIDNNRYHLVLMDDMEIISNGTTRWLINNDSQEIIVSNDIKGTNVSNFMENPFVILTNPPKNLKFVLTGAIAANIPQEITITGFTSDFSKWTIKITSFKKLQKGTELEDAFIFNKSKYNGYEMTDLR